jgi:hypothetical protein
MHLARTGDDGPARLRIWCRYPTRLAMMDFLTENIVRTDGPQVTGRDGVHQPMGREQRNRTTGERTDDHRWAPDLAVGVGIPRGVEIERLS